MSIMQKRLRKLLQFVVSTAIFLPLSAFSEWGLNLPSPASPIAREILDLHNAIMVVCLVIFIVVFGVMFYSLYAHRKSRGHEAHQFSHNSKLEVVWTIIPFFILVGMAIPSTATLLFMEDTTESDLTVKITDISGSGTMNIWITISAISAAWQLRALRSKIANPKAKTISSKSIAPSFCLPIAKFGFC